jgi:predicted metal-dependent hydrolase
LGRLAVCLTHAHLEPPDSYTVCESPRARHVRLRLSLRDGLVVVVPRGFDRRLLPGLLAQKQRWLERAWARLQAGRGHREPAAPARLPTTLDLRAVGEVWTVEYGATASAHGAVRANAAYRLCVAGQTTDRRACVSALRRWLGRKAHQHLEPRLAELARAGGFRYNRVLIKSQRTLWGSCSAHGTISLSLKLLFLPPELVRTVLLHELCHTVERNHSQRFWALLQGHEPAWRSRRKELRAAGHLVPCWLDER